MYRIVKWDVDYDYTILDTKRSGVIGALVFVKDTIHYIRKIDHVIDLGETQGYFEPLPGESNILYLRATGFSIRARIGDGSYNDYWARRCYTAMVGYVEECPHMKTVRFDPIIVV